MHSLDQEPSGSLEQKYQSAYYCWIPGYTTEHYMMFRGIRTRHGSKEEAVEQCRIVNSRYGLPDITL